MIPYPLLRQIKVISLTKGFVLAVNSDLPRWMDGWMDVCWNDAHTLHLPLIGLCGSLIKVDVNNFSCTKRFLQIADYLRVYQTCFGFKIISKLLIYSQINASFP